MIVQKQDQRSGKLTLYQEDVESSKKINGMR